MAVEVAFVERRNGAWFISLGGTRVTPKTLNLFDCAGDLPRAKQVAVKRAKELGYSGPAVWETRSRHWYVLEMEDK